MPLGKERDCQFGCTKWEGIFPVLFRYGKGLLAFRLQKTPSKSREQMQK